MVVSASDSVYDIWDICTWVFQKQDARKTCFLGNLVYLPIGFQNSTPSPVFSGSREGGSSKLHIKVSIMSVSPKVNSKLWKVTAPLSLMLSFNTLKVFCPSVLHRFSYITSPASDNHVDPEIKGHIQTHSKFVLCNLVLWVISGWCSSHSFIPFPSLSAPEFILGHVLTDRRKWFSVRV